MEVYLKWVYTICGDTDLNERTFESAEEFAEFYSHNWKCMSILEMTIIE